MVVSLTMGGANIILKYCIRLCRDPQKGSPQILDHLCKDPQKGSPNSRKPLDSICTHEQAPTPISRSGFPQTRAPKIDAKML